MNFVLSMTLICIAIAWLMMSLLPVYPPQWLDNAPLPPWSSPLRFHQSQARSTGCISGCCVFPPRGRLKAHC